MSGSRPFAGSDGSASFASARAAAMNSDGGIVAARQTITPRPRPGNIRALFAWPMRYVVPVALDRAERAAGGDQGRAVGPGQQVLRRLLGEHRRVGHRQDDRPRAVLVHRPDDLLVERAGDARGADEHGRVEVVDHLLQAQGAVRGAPVGDRGGILGVGLLVVVEVGHVAGEQARPVEQVDPAGRLLGAEPVLGHGQRDQVGDPDPGRARTEHHDPLVDQPTAGDPDPGQHAGQAHGGGALDVVVEGAQGVAVAREDPARAAGPRSPPSAGSPSGSARRRWRRRRR